MGTHPLDTFTTGRSGPGLGAAALGGTREGEGADGGGDEGVPQ